MSTLFGMLNVGRSALTTHKLSMSVTGNNIANAATVGYVKQQVNVDPADVVRGQRGQSFGNGVTAASISRSFDSFTFNRILTEQAKTNYLTIQSNEMTAIEGAFNEASESGLRQSMSDFFSALSSLSANPNGTSERTVVLSTGESLSRRFNSLADTLNGARQGLDQKISEEVVSINQAASQIALLNRQIAAAEASGSSASNLRDQREVLARQLSESANITVAEQSNGAYTVHIAGQVLVQDDQYNTLVTQPDPANSNLQSVLIQSGSTTRDLTTLLSGGNLGGALSLRDSTIVGYQSDLDNLAFTLVNQFNTQHAAGFDQTGAAGGNFFAPLGAVANAASLISLDANVIDQPDKIAASSAAASIPGDNGNAILLYQLNEQALVSGTYTFSESALVQASLVGADSQKLEDNLAFQSKVLTELDAIKDSVSGVSTDEEATNMLKYQGAYEAAARFISAVQDMMNTLMQM